MNKRQALITALQSSRNQEIQHHGILGMRWGFRKDGYTHGYKPKEEGRLKQWIREHKEAHAQAKAEKKAAKEADKRKREVNRFSDRMMMFRISAQSSAVDEGQFINKEFGLNGTVAERFLSSAGATSILEAYATGKLANHSVYDKAFKESDLLLLSELERSRYMYSNNNPTQLRNNKLNGFVKELDDSLKECQKKSEIYNDIVKLNKETLNKNDEDQSYYEGLYDLKNKYFG